MYEYKPSKPERNCDEAIRWMEGVLPEVAARPTVHLKKHFNQIGTHTAQAAGLPNTGSHPDGPNDTASGHQEDSPD